MQVTQLFHSCVCSYLGPLLPSLPPSFPSPVQEYLCAPVFAPHLNLLPVCLRMHECFTLIFHSRLLCTLTSLSTRVCVCACVSACVRVCLVCSLLNVGRLVPHSGYHTHWPCLFTVCLTCLPVCLPQDRWTDNTPLSHRQEWYKHVLSFLKVTVKV